MRYRTLKENHLFGRCYNSEARYVGKTIAFYKLKDKKAKLLAKSHPKKEIINRIGITVSKKIGNAVVRNRAKRRIREAMLALSRECELKRGYLIVIVARDGIKKADFADICKEMVAAAKRTALTVENNETDNVCVN